MLNRTDVPNNSSPRSTGNFLETLSYFNDHDDHAIEFQENRAERISAEVSMWRAVILQAIADACSRSSRTEDIVERDRARNWLMIDNQNFPNVCSMADLNHCYVRKHAEQAINSGFLMNDLVRKIKLEGRKAKPMPYRNTRKSKGALNRTPLEAHNPDTPNIEKKSFSPPPQRQKIKLSAFISNAKPTNIPAAIPVIPNIKHSCPYPIRTLSATT
jgi:hypothetical protein